MVAVTFLPYKSSPQYPVNHQPAVRTFVPLSEASSLVVAEEGMKLVGILLLGVLVMNSCSVMPRKVLMEEESFGYSNTGINNHHAIPRDQYNNWVNSPGYMPPGDGGNVGGTG
ncbi:hypothetical protein MUK42_18182 [Musa troglodytarum]|uniref:Uncharacterized protein n=1 Tax=Musa troglodytarum TaxID=320322 RepID=A0A9E7KV10_9LILI|nr:hypothetical protein MUK42_18182 [Musa troglodytarum]